MKKGTRGIKGSSLRPERSSHCALTSLSRACPPKTTPSCRTGFYVNITVFVYRPKDVTINEKSCFSNSNPVHFFSTLFFFDQNFIPSKFLALSCFFLFCSTRCHIFPSTKFLALSCSFFVFFLIKTLPDFSFDKVPCSFSLFFYSVQHAALFFLRHGHEVLSSFTLPFFCVGNQSPNLGINRPPVRPETLFPCSFGAAPFIV